MVLIKIELLLTLTMDHGKALAKIHSVTPKGFINLIPAIKVRILLQNIVIARTIRLALLHLLDYQ